MGGRGEAEDDDLCLRIAEAGDGPAPVGLGFVGGLLLASDLLAPPDEARAEAAGSYLFFERGEPGGCFEARLL